MTDSARKKTLSNAPGGLATGGQGSPLIVGLTGPNAAGKGEAAACLVRRGFAYHSLSDVVREEATARGLTHERENLIAVGNQLRSARGAGALATMVVPRLGHRDVVDSIRNPQEVAALRQVRGFVLVGVTAPAWLRFERARARGRVGDGETREEFSRREEMENSLSPDEQQLRATLALTDHLIENSGTLADLDAAIGRLLAARES